MSNIPSVNTTKVTNIETGLDEYEDKLFANIIISGIILDSESACLADSTDKSTNDFDQ